MIKLYQFGPSGNCYKVRLLLTQLGVPFTPVEVDMRKGETRTAEFRARVPLGRVPAIELPGGELLSESNAILCTFAEGTALFPSDLWQRAQVLQWLFWEQYDHEPYVAVPRAWLAFFGVPTGKEQELADRQERGRRALSMMEQHLARRRFFAADQYTIADIALYAYTHVAPEGGLDLKPYPAVTDWLERVRSQDGHIPIDAPPDQPQRAPKALRLNTETLRCLGVPAGNGQGPGPVANSVVHICAGTSEACDPAPRISLTGC